MGWNLRPRDLGGTQVMLLSINPSLLGYLNEFNTLSHAHSVPPNRPQFSTISEWIYDWSTCLSFLGLLKSSFTGYMNDTWKNAVLMTWLSNQNIHTRTLTHTPHEAQLKPCFNATSIAAREAPLRGLHVSILDETGETRRGKSTWGWMRNKNKNSSTYRQIRLVHHASSYSKQAIVPASLKASTSKFRGFKSCRTTRLAMPSCPPGIVRARAVNHSWDYHFSRTWWLCKAVSLLINQAWVLQGWCDLIIPKGTPR